MGALGGMMVAAPTTGKRPIYFFDFIQDYPHMGGVPDFSRTLFRELRKIFGERLISAMAVEEHYLGPDAPHDVKDFCLERERLVAEGIAAAHPDSIFFFPNYRVPIERTPGKPRPRIASVIHDLQFDAFPQYFGEPFLAWVKTAFASVRETSDHVVFISNTTRDHYERLYSLPPVHSVIYNPVVANPADTPAEVPNPYLFCNVHYLKHPHKNFSGLLDFFHALIAHPGAPQGLELRICGLGKEEFEETELSGLPAATRARVIHHGYVTRDELNAFHRGSKAFISLSRFEGFNIPAAEAAIHGSPLILSDIPVHRELFADACHIDRDVPDVTRTVEFLGAAKRGAWWRYTEICHPAEVARRYAEVIESL